MPGPSSNASVAEPLSSARAGLDSRLLALIVGQLGLHSAMAGVRMAGPLHALRSGFSPAAAGLLVALFALAPVILALPAGRMADRHGYQRPMRLAIACTMVGGGLTLLASALSGVALFALLCAGALFLGVGANIGIITSQRTAGRGASSSAQRIRVFSWMGMAPSMANVIGPVAMGLAIDGAGFQAAYLLALAMPVASWIAHKRVADPRPSATTDDAGKRQAAWGLLAAPGMKRLFAINWLLSSSWDAYTFAVPVLGHERGFNASTIGLLLGLFTLSVTGVRLVIPLLAHRMREQSVLRAAMLGTAAVFASYPLANSAWLLAVLALLLGIAMGAVQPMIMSSLHQLTPDNRHGEAIALRSMVINLASSVMPLACGVAGAAMGVAALFWMMGSAVGAGHWLVAGLGPALRQGQSQVRSTR
jgi:MFS family permease